MKYKGVIGYVKILLRFVNIFMPILKTLLFVLLICVAAKYAFLNVCIAQTCPTKVADITGSLLTIAGIMFAALALTPILLVESKLKDIKEEVRRKVVIDIHQDIQRLVNAQLLIAQVHSESQSGQLLSNEKSIQEAVSLWPDIKKSEYALLGERFARTALELHAQKILQRPSLSPHAPSFSDAPFPSTSLYPSPTFYPIDLETSVQKAIFYLEFTMIYPETIDRELLFYLACMYGFYTQRYEEMIRMIERAVRLDENVKEDFSQYHAVTFLSRSCNQEQKKLERLGKKIGLELPISKERFVQIIQGMKEPNLDNYIHGYIIKKVLNLLSSPFFFIKFSILKEDGSIKVSGGIYYRDLSGRDNQPERILKEGEGPISLEELYKRINEKFYLIAIKDE